MDDTEDAASPPASPVQSRLHRHQHLARHHSTTGAANEQTPLLTSSARGRVRIHGDLLSPRPNPPGYLSRNQSYTGTWSFHGPLSRVLIRHISSALASIADSVTNDNLTFSAGGSMRSVKHHSRHPSFGQRLIQALSDRQETTTESKGSTYPDERVWYDQFTSTDWVHDSIADAYRVKELRSRKDLWGRMYAAFDATQGWILSALSGFVIAIIAYIVDVSEATMFDFKDGYCKTKWYLSEVVRLGTFFWLLLGPNRRVLTGLFAHRSAAPTALAKTGAIGPMCSVAPLSVLCGQSMRYTSFS